MAPLSPSFLKVDIRECSDQHFAILQTFGCQMGMQVRGLLQGQSIEIIVDGAGFGVSTNIWKIPYVFLHLLFEIFP